MILEGFILFYRPNINDRQPDIVISGPRFARAAIVHGGLLIIDGGTIKRITPEKIILLRILLLLKLHKTE